MYPGGCGKNSHMMLINSLRGVNFGFWSHLGCSQGVLSKTSRYVLGLHVKIYSYFKKGCWKRGTQQSRKALWVVLSSLFFKEIGTKGRGNVFVSAKGNKKSRFDRYSHQKQCIDHIPHYLSGLSRAHFSNNLSRNSCIF